MRARLKARFKEPSTWAAIASIAAVSYGIPPEVATGIVTTAGSSWQSLAAVLIPALLGIFLPEAKK